MKPAAFHHDAERELRETLDYYAEQRVGLDDEFLREFEAAIIKVRKNPLLYAVEDNDETRFCPLRRFPYTLVYLDFEEKIWIVAVAHQRRRPRYWAGRGSGDA